jgi:uncharacterized protein with beta-barrel porin domain
MRGFWPRVGVLRVALGVAFAFTVTPLAGPTPALADCQPSAATNGTVNCTTAGGTQVTTVGTGGEDNVIVTVQPGATVNVPGANAIDLFDGNTISNAGTITVDNGFFAIVVNDNNTVTNSGTIIAVGGGFGISAGNGNLIINSGTIRVDDFATGINVCCDNVVVNSGSIIGGEGAFGIFATNGTTITNSGTITVGGSGGYGIIATGDGAIGPGNNATITNSGTIIAGNDSFGIGAGINYNVVNTGTISVGDNNVFSNAVGIQVDGGTTITNSGLIRAGLGSLGIEFNAFGNTTANTLINSGSIIVPLGAAMFGDSNNTVINNGYIQGQILLVGTDNTVINNGYIQGQVALGGPGSTFTNNGYLIAGDPTAFGAPAGVFIGGTLTNGPNGTFAIRVDPTSNDTFIAEILQLNGRLQTVVTAGLYNATTTYSGPIQVCGCVGSLTGTFATVVSSSPFFTAAADYSTANQVDVTLTRIGFGSVPGMTPNQRAVGNALEPGYSTTLTGNAATFFGNLLATTSVTALDQLSGEGTSAAQNAAFSAGSLFNGAMQTQGLFAPDLGGLSVVIPPAQYAATRIAPGHEAFASLDKTAALAQQPGRFRVWTAGFGATQSLRGEADTGAASQSVRSAGGVLGFDWQAAPDLRVGVAVGGSESTFSVASLSTSGRMTAGHIGAYGMKTWGAYYVAASLSYARFDNSTTRTITGVGPTETLSGRFDSDQLSGRVELGWKQAYGRFNVTPFVAVEPSVVWQHGFTESSTGVFGLTVASQTVTSLPTFVGVQVDGRYVTPEGAVLAPYSRLSWVHEFEPDRRVSAAFVTVPGASFTVNGARAANDAARLDTGAKLTFRGGLALFANFTGEWSDHTHSYAGSGGFRYAW